MEGESDPNLFEDIEASVERMDQGMTFHQKSCEVCMRGGRQWANCEDWMDLVEQRNFLNLAVIRHQRAVDRSTDY